MDILKSQTETTSVNSLLNDLSLINGKTPFIVLDVEYQRDIVWDEEKQSSFINSVMIGIIPNPIIFNVDDDKKICLDGKQRLTSLQLFKNNKISVKIDDCDYFYGPSTKDVELVQNIKSDKIKILDSKQRTHFLNTSIQTVKYFNLSYEQQVDIFNRLQNGVELKQGELIIASIKDKNISSKIKEFVKSKKNLIKYFSLNGFSTRGEDILFITDLLCLLNNDSLIRLNKKVCQSFLTSLSSKILKDLLNKVDNIVDVMYSDEVFNSPNLKKISNKITIAEQLVYSYYVYKNIILKKKKINYCVIRQATQKTYNYFKDNKIPRSKSNIKSLNMIYESFDKNYNMSLKLILNKKQVEKEPEDKQIEEIDDSDDDSDDDEIRLIEKDFEHDKNAEDLDDIKIPVNKKLPKKQKVHDD